MMPTMMVSILGLEFVAKADVESAHDEEQNYQCAENDVVHNCWVNLHSGARAAPSCFLPLVARGLARPFTEARVEPVHAGHDDDTCHNKFAHKLSPTVSNPQPQR